MDTLWVPTDTSPIVKQRWISYLQAQGMTPTLLGSTSAEGWDGIEPYRTHPDGLSPLPLAERRRFYWTVRFIHWDSCRYMAEWTAALQEGAKDPNFQTYVNWNSEWDDNNSLLRICVSVSVSVSVFCVYV